MAKEFVNIKTSTLNKNVPIKESLDFAQPIAHKIVLKQTDWDSTNKTQTITVDGINKYEIAQKITILPTLQEMFDYYNLRVTASSQTENTLVFTCDTIPDEDLDVYVVVKNIYPSPMIYGAKYDRSKLPIGGTENLNYSKWTRTDDSKDFADPQPAIGVSENDNIVIAPFNFTEITRSGVTITIDSENSTITYNGTATANIYITIKSYAPSDIDKNKLYKLTNYAYNNNNSFFYFTIWDVKNQKTIANLHGNDILTGEGFISFSNIDFGDNNIDLNNFITKDTVFDNVTLPLPQCVTWSTTGSSPFDNIYPWAGMVRVTDPEAGEVVAIPKFYYKWTQEDPTNDLKLQISMYPHKGFYVSPAHMDRGDGKGERDVIYVGRYTSGSGNYGTAVASLSKKSLYGGLTRDQYRTRIHNLGQNVWQWDYATVITIQMLYIVEFSTWDCKYTIGYGCSVNSERMKNGSTDYMEYCTGTLLDSRTKFGASIQYRYIEGLWDNTFEWIDGIYMKGEVKNKGLYAILNPNKFSDTENGTLIVENPIDARPYNLTVSNVDKYNWLLYNSGPNSYNLNRYVATTIDYYVNSTGYYCFYTGGGVSQVIGRSSIFYLAMQPKLDSINSSLCSRLMILP